MLNAIPDSYQIITNWMCKKFIAVVINGSSIRRMATKTSYIPNRDISEKKLLHNQVQITIY